MNAATEYETEKILAELPDRISDVIKPFARESPDHPALVQGNLTWSYGELAAVVADTALILKHYDIRPGDRVMIISENSLALVALILAIAELDAWSVVVNPRLSAREIDLTREHSGARRVFYTVKVSDAARQHAERHEADIAVLRGLGTLGVGPLNRDTVPERAEADRSRQIAALVYTSGTTGNPKGVMLTHRNLLFSARIMGAQRNLADKAYCVLPISHIVGFSGILIASLMAGATVHLVPCFDPAALVSAIANDGITLMFGVPATYQRLLEYKAVAGIEKLPRGKLRRLTVAGAPLDVALKSRVETEFGLPLSNGYGITECAPAIAGARAEAPRSDDAVGTLITGIEARLVTPGGGAVVPGEVGELHVRGPNVMRGYYRNPEATAAAIDVDGWFNTGDLARFEDEILYIVGRTKELIIRSGFNVHPAEVEAVLNEHPAVAQSAVIGRSVPGNEEVVAFVQLLPASTVTPSDLMAHVARLLTAYKRPSEIIIVDALPAASTGKILKHRLADAARDRAIGWVWEAGLEYRSATAAVIGAGDFIGAAIAKKFASEGFTVFAGRRKGEKLAPLVAQIEAADGRVVGRSLDARKEEEITAFLQDAEATAPLDVCVFNIGANVNFPLLETTERVFRKVWEMACYAGFLTGREAARLMLPRGRGNIFFTGATAGMRGGIGYTAFASAKFGLRAVAQSAARELGPKGIHVAHLVIDAGVDTAWVRERIKDREGEEALANLDPGRLMRPASVAEAYWQIYQEPRDAWSFEREIRPSAEKW